MSKYRLILIRHGETNFNKKGAYQGVIDVSLSEKGIEQAKKLRDLLSKSLFQGCDVITSKLKRSIETASFISQEYKSYQELNEMNFGLWEGLTSSEVNEKFPNDLAEWKKRDVLPTTRPTDGESFIDLEKRVFGFLSSLDKYNFRSKTLILVTHVYVIKSVLDMCLGTSSGYHHNRLWLDTASISIVDWSNDANRRIIHRVNWTPEIDSNEQMWSKI